MASISANIVGRPVWAEISGRALVHNLRLIRRHVGRKCKILAIVKANAYGHGAVPVAKTLLRAGADWLGVTCVEEGLQLREAGIRSPILILSGFWPGQERDLLLHGLTPAITRLGQLTLLHRAARRRLPSSRPARWPFPVHLKIDTGMNRLGLSPDSLDQFVAELAECPSLSLGGTFTHFASSEDFRTDQTEEQVRLFHRALDRLRSLGVQPGLLHMANSAAVVLRPDTWADMVRPGALLYGYHQFFEPAHREAKARRLLPLRPVLSLRSRIISLRDVPAGQGVGYNSRFITRRPSRIAVIAAGYADGVVRRLTNQGEVLVRGHRAPIVGTISMDLSMLDVTEIPGVAVDDVVTIFGESPDNDSAPLYVSEVARRLGTVSSDLLCSIGSRVPRLFLD
jgi:alanine racemase